MNAESARQLRLLDLQAIDTRLDQIAHARTPPAAARRARRPAGKARLIDDQLVRSRTELDDVQREVAKAESDVQLVRDRAARDQARLDAGTGSAKDLQAIQHELDLARPPAERARGHRARGDGACRGRRDRRRRARARPRASSTARIDALEAARDEALARLDGEAADVGAPARRPSSTRSAPTWSPSTRRSAPPTAASGPPRCASAAAAAASSSSTRSRSSGSASAPEDEVLRCEECRRILVRTAESGL